MGQHNSIHIIVSSHEFRETCEQNENNSEDATDDNEIEVTDAEPPVPDESS